MGILGPDLLIRVLNQSFTQTCKIHVRRGERTIVGIKLLNIFQTTHVKNKLPGDSGVSTLLVLSYVLVLEIKVCNE